MPMHSRRVVWLTSFAVALALSVWMRSADYGWLATLGATVGVWAILPLVISQVYAAFVLGRMHRQMSQSDGLAEKIAQATKGLPPEEQLAIGKRMIDEHFK